MLSVYDTQQRDQTSLWLFSSKWRSAFSFSKSKHLTEFKVADVAWLSEKLGLVIMKRISHPLS